MQEPFYRGVKHVKAAIDVTTFLASIGIGQRIHAALSYTYSDLVTLHHSSPGYRLRWFWTHSGCSCFASPISAENIGTGSTRQDDRTLSGAPESQWRTRPLPPLNTWRWLLHSIPRIELPACSHYRWLTTSENNGHFSGPADDRTLCSYPGARQ